MIANSFRRYTFAALLALVAAFSVLTPQQAQAQAFSDYAENKITDALLRAQSLGAPATWYIALYTTSCTDSAGGTEVANANNYARASFTPSLANWSGTQAAASTTASSGTGGVSSNNGTISFNVPSGSWGTVTHFGLVDSATHGAGNLWVCIDLSPDQTIGSGNTVSFAAGAFTVTVQ